MATLHEDLQVFITNNLHPRFLVTHCEFKVIGYRPSSTVSNVETMVPRFKAIGCQTMEILPGPRSLALDP